MTEVAVYTVLAAAIASGVLIIGGRPYWHAATVIVAALLIIILLAAISRRSGRPTRTNDDGEHRGAAGDWDDHWPAVRSRRGRRRHRRT